jgi:branched-chain amino acid transport system substrate-binding protein
MVGLLTDLTGAASSTFADTPDGAQARFSLQNAEGGINGRTLRLDVADTGSTPVGAENAAQALVAQKKVFGVIAVSALTFGGSAYLHQEGIPVTGSALDGPEWYTEPNNNMFNLEGTSSPRYPSYTSEGQFYKSLGVGKIGFVADDTPSSARGVRQVSNSIRNAGLHVCTSIVIHLGAVDFNVIALQLKQFGCDAAECSCLLSSSLALATALHDHQVHIPLVFDAGPAQQILQSPGAIGAATGNYFPTLSAYSGPGYNAFINGLKQYDPHYSRGLPDLGVLDGWLAADLFIRGLQVAGPNPTRNSFISQLRRATTWSGNGLRPGPDLFAPFGQAPSQFCLFYLKLQNSQYLSYPSDGKPFCGTLIPNSNAS